MTAVGRSRRVGSNRVHDYLYDPSYVVSGARDHARRSFKAAMESAQIHIFPDFECMFSDTSTHPRYRLVYYPNCRLPPHMDLSYDPRRGGERRVSRSSSDPAGADRYKYFANPNRAEVPLSVVEPQLQHSAAPSDASPPPARPLTRGMQTDYRESSAQTTPWQPDGKMADGCEETPEVMLLDQLEWGPPFMNDRFRTGDLPVDFHTTEIINKMRHTRKWNRIAEHSEHRDQIIADLETGDWVFREAEIDELQGIRLELLAEEMDQNMNKRLSRVQKKLQKRWQIKKKEMTDKIESIRRNRDRELRKLESLRRGGGREGQAERARRARGGGDVTAAAADAGSRLYAPLTRHGLQAAARDAAITCYPDLLTLEERRKLDSEPAWRAAPRPECRPRLPPGRPCERETRFGEEFLRTLHASLMQARLGADVSAGVGPCSLLVPRKDIQVERPSTPRTEPLSTYKEDCYQAAVLLQRTLRGRAVQMLMREGCERAKELIAELRTTHGLQKRDKERVEKEEIATRDLIAKENDIAAKEYLTQTMADQISGKALSVALGFLEKELRRLKQERALHAFILVAKREKAMREAAEAGRRQLEEQRRYEHDQMFKKVVGVTQETVDEYLREMIRAGAERCAEGEAEREAERRAGELEDLDRAQADLSAVEQNELVAELVQQFAIPEAQRAAARGRIRDTQRAGLRAVRAELFAGLDSAVAETVVCEACRHPLQHPDCGTCPCDQMLKNREDPRWRYIRRPSDEYEPTSVHEALYESRERPKQEKDIGERFPPAHEFRCLLNALLDEGLEQSARRAEENELVRRDMKDWLEEKIEIWLDSKGYAEDLVETAVGLPPKKPSPPYRHYMYRYIKDAIKITPDPCTGERPTLLPSEVRARAEQARLAALGRAASCRCVDDDDGGGVPDASGLLPSQLRALMELHRCICDDVRAPSPSQADSYWEHEANIEEEGDVEGEEE